VSVNGGFFFGRLALHFAAGRGHVSTIQFLLARGANPNQRFGCSPPIGWASTTPLMTAAFNGQGGAVRALLDGGADPRARRYFLRGIQSALSSARDGGHREVAELLLLATAAPGS
jgi:ankyrin repeat protein